MLAQNDEDAATAALDAQNLIGDTPDTAMNQPMADPINDINIPIQSV